MKQYVLLFILTLAVSRPACAGHGTLTETDTEIIVEYCGDADDKLAIKSVQETSADTGMPATAGAVSTDQKSEAQPDARSEARINREAMRRQKDESRRGRREAQPEPEGE
jgi:hypothetical protein